MQRFYSIRKGRLRPAENLVAGNEKMKKATNYFDIGKNSPDFDVFIRKMTKSSKNWKNRVFFTSTFRCLASPHIIEKGIDKGVKIGKKNN